MSSSVVLSCDMFTSQRRRSIPNCWRMLLEEVRSEVAEIMYTRLTVSTEAAAQQAKAK